MLLLVEEYVKAQYLQVRVGGVEGKETEDKIEGEFAGLSTRAIASCT